MKKLVMGYLPFGNWPLGAIEPFDALFSETINLNEGLGQFDCLILWGGTDIHPSYYHQRMQKYNGAPRTGPSYRDRLEWKAMVHCKAENIPMIGVCRGAQFGCVFSGGSLAQHVTGHGSQHRIFTKCGKDMFTTSVHHQMMNTHGIPHELLAWADKPYSQCYLNGEEENIKEMVDKPEPEIVFFPETRFLAIQGHPEYSDASNLFRKLSVDLVAQYLLEK